MVAKNALAPDQRLDSTGSAVAVNPLHGGKEPRSLRSVPLVRLEAATLYVVTKKAALAPDPRIRRHWFGFGREPVTGWPKAALAPKMRTEI